MLLIVNEKPSQARNFAKALGGTSGTYNGTEYRITALRGHLLGMKKDMTQQVDSAKADRYKSWDATLLPWDAADVKFEKTVRGDAQDVLDELADELESADAVCIATDVDPSGEGELLAWEALERCGWDGPTKRMYFADEAPASVRKAFENMADIPSMEEDGDYVKAHARECWDFLSMQFTRAATYAARTRGWKVLVRQGRLKSVMVEMVGAQLEAIANYKKVPYYEARFKDENGNAFARDPETDGIRKADKAEAEAEAAALHESAVVVDERKMKRTAPGKLLDLAGLSSILASKGYDPKDVLDTYQKMYEDQIVSYPRTEDKKITHEQFEELLPHVDAIAAVVGVDPGLLTHREPRRTHVAEGGAHGANRPGTNVPASLDELAKYGRPAKAIYKLLAMNYLAMLAEDYEYEQMLAHVADYPEYKGKVNVPKKPGFKAVLDVEAESTDEQEDDAGCEFGSLASPYVYEGSNKKPPYPTMKWLIKKLEKYNVGTGATRTSTIADVTKADDRQLMEQKKGKLSLTEIGKISYTLLDGCRIASPEATQELFETMERVGRFEEDPATLEATVAPMVAHDRDRMLANAAKLPQGQTASAGTVVGKCPRCGRDAVAKKRSVQCSSNRFAKDDEGNWKLAEGCGWSLPRKVAGKELTDKQIESILAGKKPLVKGLVSKAGKKFEARLVLKDGKIEFDFDGVGGKKRSGSRRGKAGR